MMITKSSKNGGQIVLQKYDESNKYMWKVMVELLYLNNLVVATQNTKKLKDFTLNNG